MAEAQPTLRDRKLWQRRVRGLAELAHERPVVFIVGSGLSWCDDGTGVWPVTRMVEEGRKLLREKLEQGGETVDVANLPTQYQPLMEALAQEDPELPNVLVRRAVLNACTDPEATGVAKLRGEPQRSACARLQARREAWRLPPGVDALARLIRWIEENRGKQAPQLSPPCIITTNFDELLEIALGRVGVPCESQTAILDTRLRGVAYAVAIWHVHGNWQGTHTLHSQAALETQRPELADALARRFEGARICVLGYGAWDDVVFRTITAVMAGRFTLPPEILWSFFESSDEGVRRKYAHVFSALRGVLVDRVCFARGVDVHVDLRTITSTPEHSASGAGDSDGGGGNDETGRRSASPERSSTAEFVRQLLAATPDRLRPHLESLLVPASDDPDFCLVLAELCKVLQQIGDPIARARFVAAARPVVSVVAARVTEPIRRDVDLARRDVLSVSVQTPLLAELLMAGAQQRELRFVGPMPTVRGADLIYDETEEPLLERGPAEEDWALAFEAALWRMLRPTKEESPLERERLHGELEARSLLGERCYALIDREASRVDWARVASTVSNVTLIPRSGKPSHSLRLNEYTLAALVRRFLELGGESFGSSGTGGAK